MQFLALINESSLRLKAPDWIKNGHDPPRPPAREGGFVS